MMQVFVDDKRIDEEGIEGGTLGDAVRHVQAGLPTPGRVVAGIVCDGETIEAADMVASLKRPLTEFDRIDVITRTPKDLVIDVMTQAAVSLEESESQAQKVAEFLLQGRSMDARQSLAECLHIWQQIYDAVARSLGLLDVDPESMMVGDEPLLAAIAGPRDVLVQVRDALMAGDEVLLADILQHEFSDAAQTWHAILGSLRRRAEMYRDA